MSGAALCKPVQASGHKQHWMDAYGIPFEGRVTVSKEQLEAMQRPTEDLKAQLWGTGMLHSPGYQGELAQTSVPIKGGGYEVVPLTPGLISQELAAVALNFYNREGIDTDELLKHVPAKLRTRFPDPAKCNIGVQRKLKVHVLRWPKQELRTTMEQLETEGLLERRTADGRLLRELSPDELRRLPSGSIRMYFFLRPKPAALEIVQYEWLATINTLEKTGKRPKTGRAANPTSLPSVRRILDLFGVLEQVGRKKLTDEEYQKSVVSAYEDAKKTFLARLEIQEVGLPTLPEVQTAALPEVVPAGGCIEYRSEEGSEPHPPAVTVSREKLASYASPEEVAELQDSLHDVASVAFRRLEPKRPNAQTCRNILRVARRKHPEATVAQIAAAVGEWAQDNPNFETWGGVFNLLKEIWLSGAATAGAY